MKTQAIVLDGEPHDITDCPRCGGMHVEVLLMQFATPPVDSGGVAWVWWGICPVTGEPVLGRDAEDVED